MPLLKVAQCLPNSLTAESEILALTPILHLSGRLSSASPGFLGSSLLAVPWTQQELHPRPQDLRIC